MALAELVSESSEMVITQVMPREHRLIDAQVTGKMKASIVEALSDQDSLVEVPFFSQDPANDYFLIEVTSGDTSVQLEVVSNFVCHGDRCFFYKGRSLGQMLTRFIQSPKVNKKPSFLGDVLDSACDEASRGALARLSAV